MLQDLQFPFHHQSVLFIRVGTDTPYACSHMFVSEWMFVTFACPHMFDILMLKSFTYKQNFPILRKVAQLCNIKCSSFLCIFICDCCDDDFFCNRYLIKAVFLYRFNIHEYCFLLLVSDKCHVIHGKGNGYLA